MSALQVPTRIDSSRLAISTEKLARKFGRVAALRGADITVPEGAFYLLVGPNGAGKSTIMRVLLDIIRADSGVAHIIGIDTRAGALVRAQIGWVPEKHDAQYQWMRVAELLRWTSAYYPSWDHDYEKRLLSEFRVDSSRRLARLSKGELRRVQLILALAHRPPVLLLDEPTDGLDPAARETMLAVLSGHIAESPTTVFVSTHLVYELEGLADHIGVLQNGKVSAQIRRSELESSMRWYSFDVPAGWNLGGEARAQLTLVRSNAGNREQRWMVWGNEEQVARKIQLAGGNVRDVSAVTLEEAAVALVANEEVG